MAYTADVTDSVSAARAHEAALAAFGPPLLAFNSAGITGFEGVQHNSGPTKAADLLAVTLGGLWNCMQAQLPAMLDAGTGSLVNNASAVGPIAKADEAAHLAAQHAIVGLTRAAAVEHAERGIRINAICAGLAGTPPEDAFAQAHPDLHRQWQQTPPQGLRPGAEGVASAALWLCSDDSSLLTGHALPVDGGLPASSGRPHVK
jgi:NAD(P)-dependent dehydrogenase (short-subunit alcohol dehydrogenase family)